MLKPSTVAFDANVCLTHAMNLGAHMNIPVCDHNCKPVQRFVDGCRKDGVRIGTYQKTKKHSYAHLTERVNEVADDCYFPAWYAASSLFAIAQRNLDNLFLTLTIFPDNCTYAELVGARGFFKAHGCKVKTLRNPKKKKVPETHDLEFLVSSHHLSHPGKTHIASNDSHFTKNIQAIESTYDVIIAPQNQFDVVANSFGWP